MLEVTGVSGFRQAPGNSVQSPLTSVSLPALTTVEGLISRAISGLEQDQPLRRVSRGLSVPAQEIMACGVSGAERLSFLCSPIISAESNWGRLWPCFSASLPTSLSQHRLKVSWQMDVGALPLNSN